MNASKQCVGSRRGTGLDVVVDPEVVVADTLGELRELDRAVPRVGRVPTGVLELPTLRDERAVAQRAHLKSQYWISTIIGSRYPT